MQTNMQWLSISILFLLVHFSTVCIAFTLMPHGCNRVWCVRACVFVPIRGAICSGWESMSRIQRNCRQKVCRAWNGHKMDLRATSWLMHLSFLLVSACTWLILFQMEKHASQTQNNSSMYIKSVMTICADCHGKGIILRHITARIESQHILKQWRNRACPYGCFFFNDEID